MSSIYSCWEKIIFKQKNKPRLIFEFDHRANPSSNPKNSTFLEKFFTRELATLYPPPLLNFAPPHTSASCDTAVHNHTITIKIVEKEQKTFKKYIIYSFRISYQYHISINYIMTRLHWRQYYLSFLTILYLYLWRFVQERMSQHPSQNSI